MSRYDFALESSAMIAQRKRDDRVAEERRHLALGAPRGPGAPLEGFASAKQQPNSQRKFFRPPDLPPGYKAVHEAKRSRWDVNSKGENVAKKQGLGRHDLDARVRYSFSLHFCCKVFRFPQVICFSYFFLITRASILDEPLPKLLDIPAVDAVPSQLKLSHQVPAENLSVGVGSVFGTSTFKPFVSQPDKQARYERFLEFSKSGQRGKFIHFISLFHLAILFNTCCMILVKFCFDYDIKLFS